MCVCVTVIRGGNPDKCAWDAPTNKHAVESNRSYWEIHRDSFVTGYRAMEVEKGFYMALGS